MDKTHDLMLPTSMKLQVNFAALQQLEAADGIEKTPFVTIRATPEEDGTMHVDALQVAFAHFCWRSSYFQLSSLHPSVSNFLVLPGYPPVHAHVR